MADDKNHCTIDKKVDPKRNELSLRAALGQFYFLQSIAYIK